MRSLLIAVEPAAGWTLVGLAGELDYSVVGELRRCLDRVLWGGQARIALDLSALEFCDSMGFGAVIGAWKRARAAGGDLLLVGPNERIRATLTVLGLGESMTIVELLPFAWPAGDDLETTMSGRAPVGAGVRLPAAGRLRSADGSTGARLFSAGGAGIGRGVPSSAGDWRSAMLDAREIEQIAALLEELANGHPQARLSVAAARVAAVLRERAALAVPTTPASRRDGGDNRDHEAELRDHAAGARDLSAGERDALSRERDARAEEADHAADTADRRIHDLLWAAELRDRAAADHAAAAVPADDAAAREQIELDREMAAADRERASEERAQIRELLAEARNHRLAAERDRSAGGRDRQAAHQDRRMAQTDRRAAAGDRGTAQAERDQAVIDSEQTSPPKS